jgi:hypothetical protein
MTILEELRKQNDILKKLGKDAEERSKFLDAFINARVQSRPASEKERILKDLEPFKNEFRTDLETEMEATQRKLIQEELIKTGNDKYLTVDDVWAEFKKRKEL